MKIISTRKNSQKYFLPQYIGVILLFLSFYVLRVYNIARHELWYDEIFTVSFSACPWMNWNAPLYWFLMHFWLKLFGVTELSLRFPSLLFSFFSVLIVYFLGKKLFGKKTAVIASLLMGLSPFSIWYAQEARDYAMALFAVVLSAYYLHATLKDNSAKNWIFFTICSIVGIYTNYFFVVFFIAELLFVLLAKSGKSRVVYLLLPPAAFIYYAVHFLNKFNYVRGGFWLPKPGADAVLITLANFICGYTASGFLYVLSMLFALAGLVLAFKSYLEGEREKKDSLLFCFFLALVPLSAVYVFSSVFFSIYLDRGLIIFSPFFYLLTASGISALDGRVFRLVLSLYIGLSLISLLYHYGDNIYMPDKFHSGAHIKKPVKPIIDYLNDNLSYGDVVAFSSKAVIPSFRFYDYNRNQLYHIFDESVFDTNWNRPEIPGKYNVPVDKVKDIQFKRLWLVSTDFSRDGSLNKNSIKVRVRLKSDFQRVHTLRVTDALISCYVRKIEG